MSYSQLYEIKSNGDMEPGLEQRNASWLTVVWGTLVERYRRLLYPNEGIFESRQHPPMDAPETLWKRYKELPLRPWERDVLEFTFDWALVPKDGLAKMAASMRRWADAHAKPGVVCHAKAWADELDRLSGDPECQGVGLYGHSVGDCLWWVSAKDVDDDGRSYNINVDSRHWWIEVQGPEAA